MYLYVYCQGAAIGLLGFCRLGQGRRGGTARSRCVDNPEQVQSLLDSGAEITRTAVSALRAEPDAGAASEDAPAPSNKLIARANAACDRLERALGRIQPSNSYKVALPELIALRIRVEDITKLWPQGAKDDESA